VEGHRGVGAVSGRYFGGNFGFYILGQNEKWLNRKKGSYNLTK